MRKDLTPESLNHYIRLLCLEPLFPPPLLSKLELHCYESGELVSIAGEPAEYFCICVSGKMKIQPSSEEGKVVLLDYIKPLEFLGDIELFCGCDNLHSVRALAPSMLLAIPRKIFEGEMMENVAFLKFVSKRLAGKLFQSSKNHSRSMLYPVKNRFCHYLLQLCEERESNIFPVKTAEAAQYLGITDRHLRRIFAELECEGLLVQHSSIITILDRRRLTETAAYL